MATLGWVVPAWALNQPGSTVPLPFIDDTVTSCSNNNVQLCLDEEEGEPSLIDAQADGKVVPEIFDPRCCSRKACSASTLPRSSSASSSAP